MADEKKAQKTDYVKHQLSQKKKEDEKAATEEKVEVTKKDVKPVATKDDKSKTKEEKPKKASKKEDKKEEKKFVKESIHTIPLKKAFDHPKTRRVKYAIREIKRYIAKHTRKEAFVDPKVNEKLWENSIQNPPRKIKVKIQEEEKRATAVLE